MKLKKLDHLRQQEQVQHREAILQQEKIFELYIVPPTQLRMVYEENTSSTVPNPRRQDTTTNRQSDKDRKLHGDQNDVQTEEYGCNPGQAGLQTTLLHDYSVIIPVIDMDEEYAKTMIIDTYQQTAKKRTSAYNHRFIVFMIQHHAKKTKDVMRKAGLTDQEIDKVYDYFDERAPNLFNGPTDNWGTTTTTKIDCNKPLPRPYHQLPCSGRRHGNRSRHKGYSTTSTTTVLKLTYYVFGYDQDNDNENLVYNDY
eukprot:6475814-Amphidinium_carterae.1